MDPVASETSHRALEALRRRFSASELKALAAKPYPDVVREARERGAALLSARWEETEESRLETGVIQAVSAFVLEFEAQAGAGPIQPWDGGML